MLQLVYISTARQPVTPELLDSVLDASRRNNRRCGVTGLLVAGGRRFLQVLEGPDQAVLATYARIQNDPRHFAFVLLSSRPVEERAFGDWEMAYQLGGDVPSKGDLQDIVAGMTATLSDKTLHAHLNGFAAVHARAAA